MERARNRVVEGGYKFKKGKSRSKQSNDPPKLKFEKSTECMRKQNIAALEEDIKDLKDRLQFKEKRRHQSEMARNYKVCDQLTEEMTALKKKKRESETELKFWMRKVQKSTWYNRRKNMSTSETENDNDVRQRRSITPVTSFEFANSLTTFFSQ